MSTPEHVMPSENRHAVIRLAAVVVVGVVLAAALHALAVLVVIAALIAMVMLHEFGHFVVAKLSGMKVTEFFFGFGPRLWSIRRGETEYGVKAIPAGGYVRIPGMTGMEEVDPADEERSYREATFPRRVGVSIAGSAMHFLIAFGLLWGLISFTGIPVATPSTVSGLTQFVGVNSPAKAAGLKVGDVLVSVNGDKSVAAYIAAHPDQKLNLVVIRDDRFVHLSITPINATHLKVKEGSSVVVFPAVAKSAPGRIGIEISTSKDETSNPLIAVQRVGTMLGSVTKATALGIGDLFSFHGLSTFAHSVETAGNTSKSNAAASSSRSSPQFISIVGAVQIGAQAASQDISELLYLLVAINIFIGMVNLFPMLPLDGGHLAIACYERIRSRRSRRYHADVSKLIPVAYLFLAFMVVISMSALYMNIVQPVHLPGN